MTVVNVIHDSRIA